MKSIARFRRIIVLTALLTTAAGMLPAADTGTKPASDKNEFKLRGYRDLVHSSEQLGDPKNQVTVHHFTFENNGRAVIFTSKIFSDSELTKGNTIKAVKTSNSQADIIDLDGSGFIAPLLSRDSRKLAVITGSNTGTAAKWIDELSGKEPVLRRTELSHPKYLDKWDRYCLGMWQYLSDFERDGIRKTPDEFYKWMGEIGLNPQLNAGNTALELTASDNVMTFYRNLFKKHDVEYQRIEWLPHNYDLYNRNPFLTHSLKPDIASRWSYYGERNLANNPLRTVQNASILNLIKKCSADENQMGILDPDGEIGPFDTDYFSYNGPMTQREFVRFLKEVRKLSLSDVSKRYYGRPDAIRNWEDLPIADWREFYGWNEKSVDLAGEWRFMPDSKLEGFTEGWSMPEFDDSDWVRLYYPGDALVFSMASTSSPLWMRKTVKLDAGRFNGKVFISLAPLSDKSVQVFLNGKPLGALDPRFHTAKTFGQFDISEEVAKGGSLTFVLRLASKDCPYGPIFLTSKKLEDFPTSDPLVNARRWDHMEFVDWVVAQSVGTTLDMIRSVDPDRPIKVHAYGESPWGWKTVAQYGGYSHFTGNGSGWQWAEPKQFGASRGLQDSSEPGGPMPTLRDLKGIWGNMIFMGKNAHDYFINLQSITRDPEMRAYFEKKIPAIKVMGRLNVVISPIAVIRGTLNSIYRSECSYWPLWKYGVNSSRGGDLIPYLDEVRIREGNLDDFPVIVDEGAECWDDAMTSSLRSYVEAGGILVINSMSGTSNFIELGKGGGPALAGIKFGDSPANASAISFDAGQDRISGLNGSFRAYERNGISPKQILPLEGTDVIGKWPDGSPAFTRKALGKGFVYCCGASLYPSDFIKATASSFGPDAFATSAGGVDLVRTLRSNNGSEDFLMLRGLGREAETKWTLPYPPKRIYDPLTGTEIPSVIEGNTVTFKTNIDDWDFAWFAARRPDADMQFSHWFKRQTQIWSGLVTGAKEPKAPIFRHFDLNHGWKSVTTDSFDSAANLMKLDDKEAALKETELTMKSAENEDQDQFILYRKDFELPAKWKSDSVLKLAILGQIYDCQIHAFSGENSIYLNGKEIWKGQKLGKAWLDVTSNINAGVNRLEIIHKGGNGIMPSVLLVRSATPDRTVPLSEKWHLVSGFNQEADFSMLGMTKASFLYQDIIVPAEDKDKEVWLSIEGPCTYAIINGHVRYLDVNGSTSAPSPVLEIAITPDIRFGQSNRIVLGNNLIFQGWNSGELNYKQAELRFYTPGKWSLDGKGNREALTKKEIASVERDASFVRQYPMIHPKAEKKTAPVTPKNEKPFTPPPVLMDLDFTHGTEITDLGPSKVELKIQGNMTAVSEAGGKIKGIYLHGESDKPAIIEMPPKFFRDNLSNKNFTIAVWIKPMEINRSGGAIMNWGSWFFGWNISNETCSASVVSTPQRHLIAESVVRQRKWQCLALSFDGARSTLYSNGTAVGCQTWDKPMQGVDAPVFIGSVMAEREFLNAEISSFRIYSGAMDADSMKRMFISERDKFKPKEGSAYLEDDLFRLKISKDGISDEAEIPAVKIVANGTRISEEKDKTSVSFSGDASYLLITDHPRAKLFKEPFSLILDFMPEPGTSGMIFRRHHILCLELTKDGGLTFDANIGRNNRISFPGAVKFGEWNRLIFSYDGKTARLSINGAPSVEKEYPGNIGNSDYTTVFFADNTYKFPESGKLKCMVRELRIVPGAVKQVVCDIPGA